MADLALNRLTCPLCKLPILNNEATAVVKTAGIVAPSSNVRLAGIFSQKLSGITMWVEKEPSL